MIFFLVLFLLSKINSDLYGMFLYGSGRSAVARVFQGDYKVIYKFDTFFEQELFRTFTNDQKYYVFGYSSKRKTFTFADFNATDLIHFVDVKMHKGCDFVSDYDQDGFVCTIDDVGKTNTTTTFYHISYDDGSVSIIDVWAHDSTVEIEKMFSHRYSFGNGVDYPEYFAFQTYTEGRKTPYQAFERTYYPKKEDNFYNLEEFHFVDKIYNSIHKGYAVVQYNNQKNDFSIISINTQDKTIEKLIDFTSNIEILSSTFCEKDNLFYVSTSTNILKKYDLTRKKFVNDLDEGVFAFVNLGCSF